MQLGSRLPRDRLSRPALAAPPARLLIMPARPRRVPSLASTDDVEMRASLPASSEKQPLLGRKRDLADKHGAHGMLGKAFYGSTSAGAVFLLPYLNLFLRDLGATDSQIGVLCAFRPWLAMASTFVGPILADRFKCHRELLVATFFLSNAVRASMWIVRGQLMQVAALLLLSDLLGGPVGPMADSMVLATCKTDADYGRQRLWGSVGWGLCAPLAGMLVQRSGIGAGFFVYALLLVPAMAVVAQLRFPSDGDRHHHSAIDRSTASEFSETTSLQGSPPPFSPPQLPRTSGTGGAESHVVHVTDSHGAVSGVRRSASARFLNAVYGLIPSGLKRRRKYHSEQGNERINPGSTSAKEILSQEMSLATSGTGDDGSASIGSSTRPAARDGDAHAPLSSGSTARSAAPDCSLPSSTGSTGGVQAAQTSKGNSSAEPAGTFAKVGRGDELLHHASPTVRTSWDSPSTVGSTTDDGSHERPAQQLDLDSQAHQSSTEFRDSEQIRRPSIHAASLLLTPLTAMRLGANKPAADSQGQAGTAPPAIQGPENGPMQQPVAQNQELPTLHSTSGQLTTADQAQSVLPSDHQSEERRHNQGHTSSQQDWDRERVQQGEGISAGSIKQLTHRPSRAISPVPATPAESHGAVSVHQAPGDHSSDFWHGLQLLLKQPAVWQLLLQVLACGFGAGLVGTYQLLFAKDLGAGTALMGLMLTADCLAETPVFYFQGELMDLMSPTSLLHLSLGAMVLRLLLYAAVPVLPGSSPWAILPIELLQGLTLAGGWAAMCVMSKRLAPPGLQSTLQGTATAVFGGLGGGLGGLLGGLLRHCNLDWTGTWAAAALLVAGLWGASVVLVPQRTVPGGDLPYNKRTD